MIMSKINILEFEASTNNKRVLICKVECEIDGVKTFIEYDGGLIKPNSIDIEWFFVQLAKFTHNAERKDIIMSHIEHQRAIKFICNSPQEQWYNIDNPPEIFGMKPCYANIVNGTLFMYFSQDKSNEIFIGYDEFGFSDDLGVVATRLDALNYYVNLIERENLQLDILPLLKKELKCYLPK